MHPMPHRLRFALLTAVTAAVTACASGAGSQSAAFNDADVAFLQDMVPHHEQAVEMAKMVSDRTDRRELVELADTIVSTQTAEVDQMQGLLADAGEEPPADGMDHGGGGGGHSGSGMPGMMSDDDMQQLQGVSGEQFDLRFLEMMTAHHEGAVEAAETVLDEGENPEVAGLAREIIEAQKAEIEDMRTWQERWGS